MKDIFGFSVGQWAALLVFALGFVAANAYVSARFSPSEAELFQRCLDNLEGMELRADINYSRICWDITSNQ